MRNLIKRLIASRWLILMCRLVLAAVFLTAGITKIINPQVFADSVAAFRILPASTVNLFAITLPWVEILAAIALLYKSTIKLGALTIGLLNIMFLTAAASAMSRRMDIVCSCFALSQINSEVDWTLIVRDIFFLLLCLPLLIPTNNPASPE